MVMVPTGPITSGALAAELGRANSIVRTTDRDVLQFSGHSPTLPNQVVNYNDFYSRGAIKIRAGSFNHEFLGQIHGHMRSPPFGTILVSNVAAEVLELFYVPSTRQIALRLAGSRPRNFFRHLRLFNGSIMGELSTFNPSTTYFDDTPRSPYNINTTVWTSQQPNDLGTLFAIGQDDVVFLQFS